MVRLLLKEINKLLNNYSNNRNIAIVGSPGHGADTLIECLSTSSGVLSADNFPPYAPWVECNQQETYVDPASISLYTVIGEKTDDEQLSNQYLINITLPDKHIDDDIWDVIRIVDGVIIVIDFNQDINVNMQTFIEHSINAKLKIILFLDNIDANLLTMGAVNLELIYRDISEAINHINNLIYQYTSDETYTLNVLKNVAFGCVEKNWAFNLHSFADIYSKTFSRFSKNDLTKKLWSEHYYSFKEKKWSTTKRNETYERSFTRFVVQPIYTLYETVISNDRTKIGNLLTKLDIRLEDTEEQLQGKRLLSLVMRKWLPISNCILPMCISHFPSPVDAQKYRSDVIYDGTDESVIDSIKKCDENGALFMCISKKLWTNDRNGRYAFGRIYSGRIKKGDKVNVITNNGIVENKKVEKVVFMFGRYADEINDDVFCGRCCAISGLEKFVNRIATLTADQENLTLFDD